MSFLAWCAIFRFAQRKIHYHLECQDITDNGSDNKLWLILSIQLVVFATEMGDIDDKGWDSSMMCCS